MAEIEENIRSGKGREEAVQSAMDHCIERGILTDLLKSEKSEVLHMIFLTEYDEKKHLKHTFEEGREEGKKEGIEVGRREGGDEKLLEQIRKKAAKGKSPEVIAQELEEEIETIRRLMNLQK